MCAHSSSTNDVIVKISEKLYPFIADQFTDLQKFNDADPHGYKFSLLFEIVQKLQHEFESLKNYELKLVFPAVKLVFDTKNNPEFIPSVNITELQVLTQKKEIIIQQLVDEIKCEAEALYVPKGHPVYAIIYVFKDAFLHTKQQWNNMLSKVNKTCTCFAKANNTLANKEKIDDYLTHLNGKK